MHMVVFAVELVQLAPKIVAHLAEDLLQPVQMDFAKHMSPVLGHKDQMSLEIKNAVSACPKIA
jgi:hypothetical protein